MQPEALDVSEENEFPVPSQPNEADVRNSAVCKFVEQMRTGPRRNKSERH